MFTPKLPNVLQIASFVDVKQHGYWLCPVRIANMREAYETQPAQIDIALVAMSDLVGTAIRNATDALLADDLTMAELVIAGDAEINQLNVDVEEISLLIAALEAPMATDLRLVMGAVRMSGSLERMGDLAHHIAKVARLRHPERAIPESLILPFTEMGHVAEKLSIMVAAVITTRDTEMALQVEKDDDEMDDLHKKVIATIIKDDSGLSLESAIDLTLLGRYYERYADHAVSVARRVYFLVTGTFA